MHLPHVQPRLEQVVHVMLDRAMLDSLLAMYFALPNSRSGLNQAFNGISSNSFQPDFLLPSGLVVEFFKPYSKELVNLGPTLYLRT